MEGVPPGAGWYVGEWSDQHESWTWQWSGHGAPHAPGPNGGGSWSQVEDDALFMQWYMMADDGSYVLRPDCAPGIPPPPPAGPPPADATSFVMMLLEVPGANEQAD